jgi:hypothetical protein
MPGMGIVWMVGVNIYPKENDLPLPFAPTNRKRKHLLNQSQEYQLQNQYLPLGVFGWSGKCGCG